MSETAEKPLLAEQTEAPKKPKRRTSAPAKATKDPAEKPKTRKPKAASPEPDATAAAVETSPTVEKPKARTSRKKKVDTETAELALETPVSAPAPAPATPAPEAAPEAPVAPAPAPKAPARTDAVAAQASAARVLSDHRGVEEWSPSASASGKRSAKAERGDRGEKSTRRGRGKSPVHAAAESSSQAPAAESAAPAPAEAAAPAAPAPSAPAPAEASAPAPITAPVVSSDGTPIAAPPPPGRKYPVYIPRHVAKQLEAEGQTDPAAIAAAVAAATAPAVHPEAPRRERDPRDRDPRDRERGGERERDHGHRNDRDRDRDRDRGDRGDRGDRADRGDRGDRAQEGRQEAPPPRDEELGSCEGIVEISGKGFGFIRDLKRGFSPHPTDIFVTPELVRRYNLRDGQWLKGETRRGGRGAQLHRIVEINGEEPDKARTLPTFDELTVVNPMEWIRLETVPERYTTRVIDLMTPIGKGQRGLIVAPPRTGKTTLLQHIADAVVKNHPGIKLIILLVDERPEEVTEIKRTVPSAEVMASSNDMDVKSHTRIAQLAIERAKRLVESGQDVFVLLDSITRVGRAFNNATGGGGRTMSGGMDSRALEIPRKLFAAARNTEEAGSLTIIATALIETGSRMDDLIFQEFKGTGNMELVLDRKISEQRIYPAVDIFQSGTRREELLVPADDLHKIAIIRRGLAGHKPIEAIERLLFFAKKFPTNSQMLREIPG